MSDEAYLTVHEIVTEIRNDVKDLKEQAALMQVTREQIKTNGYTVRDHEKRIRALEIWRYGIPLTGILALVGALFHVNF